MQVEEWPLDRIIPYEKNPRKRTEIAVQKVAASIREYGIRQPIVVDEAGVILVGHTRRDAAALLEMPTFPVHQAVGLTEAQKRGYRIADNRTNQETVFDDLLLGEEIAALAAANFDLALTGFDPNELAQFINNQNGGSGGGTAGEDDIPEPLDDAISQRGDLWLLGEHRLLCGDSTSLEDVTRLMNGERAGLMNTDSPYGIKYDSAELHEHGVSFARIENDQHEDEQLQAFLEKAFAAASTVALKGNAAWYLWHAMLTQGFFAAAAAAAAAGVILHRQIIWVKPVLVFGRGQYHWKHELCFMGWVKGHEPEDYGCGNGERNQTTIWEVDGVSHADRKEFKHSTPKPVGLFDIPIVKHLKPGEICYEPFSGSGPQFIAAQKYGVKCYGMELAPQFVDCIVTRWQNFTGRRATLESDGRTFEEVKAERVMQPF